MHGEVVLLSDPVAALRWLDDYEGYVHGGGDRNEYDRIVCEVRLAGGETFDAWVYLLRRVPTAERRIDSGRWVPQLNAANVASFETLRAGLRTPNGPLPRRHGPRLDRGGQLPHASGHTPAAGGHYFGSRKNTLSCA